MKELKDFSRYLGIPYQAKGRDFHHCDCWGLCRLFLKEEFGIEINDYSQYGVTDLEEIKRVAEEEKKKWIKVESLNPGDIVEIPILRRDFHVGVISYPNYILHITNESFSEMSKLDHPLIKRSLREKRFWRHASLA